MSLSFTYLEDSVIAEGASGNVILRGHLGGRDIAVKRMSVDRVTLAEREIRLLEAHDAHPNILRYFGHRRNVLFIHLALELATGNLSEYCDSPQYMNVLAPREVCVQITRGLKHLHDLNIVHRNLKPSNILFLLIREDEMLMKIADYAISKTLEDRESFTSSCTVGSISWAAPEMRGRPDRKTLKTDIYSLGLVFFTVLTFGRPRDRGAVTRDMILANLNDVPNGAQRLLLREMLDLEPENRPTTAEVLVQPAFWPPEKVLSFLQEVFNLAPPDFNFEVYNELVWQGDWKDLLCPTLVNRMSSRTPKPYDGSSMRHLLRFVRNLVTHRAGIRDLIPHACSSNERLIQYIDENIPNLIYYAWLTAKGTLSLENLAHFYEYPSTPGPFECPPPRPS
nr:PREDICTED: serine/threonine-protein kinase/endoribonuclease IRE1-like isoform X1 [Bemisia tabaci]XP_018916730.1 PREDICTED: serine/threonine-protein kinase/endoribonuclease IRE1-like isoform X1 [Bemisia tabaci]